MRTRLRHGLSVAVISVICLLISAFTAFAANFDGDLETVSKTTIDGWAADKDNPDKSVEVVFYIYTDGSTQAKELARVKADQYREDLGKTLGNGNHLFSYSVNWDSLEGTSYMVQAFAVSGNEQATIGDPVNYSKNSPYHAEVPEVVKVASVGPSGPGASQGQTAAPGSTQSTPPAADEIERGKKGASLGKFIATAYCCCDRCTGGSGLTYSGTVPRAKHTISADINHFPIGTKLIIDDVVYTVEDIGSGINGKRLDIYFNTHEEALSYGRKTVDVYELAE